MIEKKRLPRHSLFELIPRNDAGTACLCAAFRFAKLRGVSGNGQRSTANGQRKI